MNADPQDPIWQKLRTALFGVQRTADERAFTAGVMADIRRRQPAESTWRVFTRWATPALVLSMASFTLALSYTLRPAEASAEALLQEDHEIELSETWLASPPNEDQILNSVVKP